MEKGLRKGWEPKHEEFLTWLLDNCQTFAERHYVMCTIGLLKYDGRTRAGKRVTEQARLRLAISADDDLKELAELEIVMLKGSGEPVEEILERLKRQRAKIIKEGVKGKWPINLTR